MIKQSDRSWIGVTGGFAAMMLAILVVGSFMQNAIDENNKKTDIAANSSTITQIVIDLPYSYKISEERVGKYLVESRTNNFKWTGDSGWNYSSSAEVQNLMGSGDLLLFNGELTYEQARQFVAASIKNDIRRTYEDKINHMMISRTKPEIFP